jgi:hypothetical protein
MFSLRDDEKSKGTATLVLPSPTSTVAENNSQEETVVEIPPEDTVEKIINVPVTRRGKKAMQTVSVPLEVHQDASSSSDTTTAIHVQQRICSNDISKRWKAPSSATHASRSAHLTFIFGEWDNYRQCHLTSHPHLNSPYARHTQPHIIGRTPQPPSFYFLFIGS